MTVLGIQQTGRTRGEPDRQHWRFDTGARVFSSPTIVDSTVFVGSQSGSVYALEAQSGETYWEFETEGAVNSSPLVVGLSEISTNTVFVGSHDRYLYALDAQSGEKRWKFETEGKIQGSPVIEGNTLFVMSDHDGVYAIDATSGEEIWHRSDRSVSLSSPSVVDNTLFYRGRSLNAIDAKTGWRHFAFGIGSGTYSSPTIAAGNAYIGDRVTGNPDIDGRLYAVDASTGNEQWRVETDEFIDSSPTVADSPDGKTVFVGGWNTGVGRADEYGSVFALDAADGTKRWQSETDGRILSSPTVADDVVFVGSVDNGVYAFGAGSGDEQWRFETGGSVRSSPTVADGIVFVGSDDGHLYALDAGTDGSSYDSRVRLGTLGHNEHRGSETSRGSSGRLDTRTRRALGLGTLGGLLSATGLLYRSQHDES